MFFDELDARTPLQEGSVLIFPSGEYTVDRLIGSGGFALAYLGHKEDEADYVIIKELFPRHADGRHVERRSDGKIVIYDPARQGPYAEPADAWDEVLPILAHEAEMTKKAMAVYNTDGKRERQNSPDVFGAYGPLCDSCGNHYLIIDTAQGEPLSDIIEAGFVKNGDGKVLTNGRLEEILEILLKLTQRLSRLHGDNDMLHLDLSPENIYVTRSGGGLEPTPYLIDYGSAYGKSEKWEQGGRPFTYNRFSAPEIRALAELNDEDAGYSPDDSSDTYSVVSILFYALTGQTFSTRLLFNQSWKNDLRREYLYAGRDVPTEKPFPELLIALFDQGLAPDQSRRFRTAGELYRMLKKLIHAYEKTGNLLNRIDRDELISYVVLDRYPLCDYRSEDGDLDVLCLGSGAFMRRMILSVLSCGQMLSAKLNIHVVSRESRRTVTDALLAAAPMLADYSDLVNREIPSERRYVSFDLETVDELLDPAAASRIAAALPACRYVIVSLGRNKANIDMARLYGKALSEAQTDGTAESLILYYDAEDVAVNVRASQDESGIADNIRLLPFGDRLSSCADSIRSLGRRALRLSHLYHLLYDPRRSLEQSAAEFVSDAYGQRSSSASALHLNYMLADLGLRPCHGDGKRRVIEVCRRALESEKRNDLLYLEHRRWLMYMIADGYRLPDMEKTESYAFRGDNGSFRDSENRWHPCLVPCGRGGPSLEKLPHTEWDKYGTEEEIDATAYDDLDKMSLKLHLLAGKKCRESRLLDDLSGGLGTALARWIEKQNDFIGNGGGAPDPAKAAIGRLKKAYESLRHDMEALYQNRVCTREKEELDELESEFRAAGLDAAEDFSAIRRDLRIFEEFSLYRDYKGPDAVIVDHLPWLLYADEELTMIKLSGRTATDQLIGPLRMRPGTLVFRGVKKSGQDALTAFLRGQGNRGSISFVPARRTGLDDIIEELDQLTERTAGRGGCVIDITGADPVSAAAAVRLASSSPKLGVVCCRGDEGVVEEVLNCPEAGAYCLPSALSAREVYALCGAQSDPRDQPYLRRLEDAADGLWEFYRTFQHDWEAVTAFFAGPGQGSAEFSGSCEKAADASDMISFQTMIDEAGWKSTALDRCFRQMEAAGWIRELNVKALGAGFRVSFRAPRSSQEAFRSFFDEKRWYAVLPFVFHAEENEAGAFVEIRSGSYVEADLGEEAPKLIPALKKLEELGLIVQLAVTEPEDDRPAAVRFSYASPAVKSCLSDCNGISALCAWHAAQQTGCFDDCRPNFSVEWKSGLRSKIDLILTKGLGALLISCMSKDFRTDRLFELHYLTERLALNSRALVLCTPSGGGEDDDFRLMKEQAQTMGIHVADLSRTSPGELGRLFIRLAEWNSAP